MYWTGYWSYFMSVRALLLYGLSWLNDVTEWRMTSDLQTFLHTIWSCNVHPHCLHRDWTQTAWEWSHWDRMEMEPSTGTSMALVCTKKSQSRGKQRRSGKQPYFCVEHIVSLVCVVAWCMCNSSSHLCPGLLRCNYTGLLLQSRTYEFTPSTFPHFLC